MIDLWHTSTSTEESKCARRANRQKVILQAFVVTVTAIAVRFKEKHIDKSLMETMTLWDVKYWSAYLVGPRTFVMNNCDWQNVLFLSFVEYYEKERGCVTRFMKAEEAYAMFLHVRVIKGAYTRSTETTSMHFKMVLNVVLKLIKEYKSFKHNFKSWRW